MAPTKQNADSGTRRKRPAVATLEEFEAAYLAPVARGAQGTMAGGTEIGLGLVKDVLRDFRRNLRS